MTDQPGAGTYRYAAELLYATTPYEQWALALLRALQLGATTIAVRPRAAWHACVDGGFDLAGRTHPQRDLLGLVRVCGRLGLAVALDLSDAPLAGGWGQALSAALAELQAPSGPISAIWAAPAGTKLAGWHVPALPPEPTLSLGLGAGHPLLRADGSARPAFWRARLPQLLLRAGDDTASAGAPADLLLLIDSASSGASSTDLAELAARLRQAGIAFHQLELAQSSPARVARYTLVIAPLALAEHPAATALAPLSNVALIGAAADTLPAPFRYKPRLAPDCSAEQIAETIEALGGRPRYAWADTAALWLEIRYGTRLTYLYAQNRRPEAYHGMLTYRAPDGAVLHLQLGIGGGQSGLVLLHADEVLGAAIDGEASEGGWLTRGLQSSVMFNNGAGALAYWGSALIATAPQSGRFQARRPAGWAGLAAYRLLLNGALLPTALQTDADHLTLPYIAEDARGATDCYLLLPTQPPLPAQVRAYLGGLLRARALLVAQLAAQAAADARPTVRVAADALAAACAAVPPEPLEQIAAYAAAWAAATAPARALIAALNAPGQAAPDATTQRLAGLVGELIT